MAPTSLQARFFLYTPDGYLTYPARVWIAIAVTAGVMILLGVAFCAVRSSKKGGMMSRWRRGGGRRQQQQQQQQLQVPFNPRDISYQGAGRHSEDLERGFASRSGPRSAAVRNFDYAAGKERHSSIPLVDHAHNVHRPESSASRHEAGFEGAPLPPPTYHEATVVASPTEMRH